MGRRRLPGETPVARVESLDDRGRGVACAGGRRVAVHCALPGERVRFAYRRRHRGGDEASTLEVLEPAPERVEPRCPHFGTCGGCRVQHMDHAAQVRAKGGRLEAALAEAGVHPARWLEPIVARPWGYRRSARLAVRYVPGKGGALVGFRELHGTRVAVLESCDILHPPVGRRLPELKRLVGGLEARARIPQVGVAAGDDATALVFRHLVPLSAGDREALAGFAQTHGLQVYLQPGGPDSVAPLYPTAPDPLRYALPDFDLSLRFEPTDFIQVNGPVNRQLTARAVELVAPRPGERVLDLFCGLGNFTLPLARRGAGAVGLEGSPALVARAAENARHNDVAGEFRVADLADDEECARWLGHGWDALLLDPPRSGAAAVVAALAPPYPQRVVYVSCEPASMARDAGVLVHRHGFRAEAAGVVDMFPHTAHLESIALFARV